MAERASHTAVLVCQARAAAHGLIAPDRFADPTAMSLLRADEQEMVHRVRGETPPEKWQSRATYEMVRGSAEILVPRTVAIDDAVLEGPRAQVVILGAGLDGRAWRLKELADSAVFEVDQPASQQDKRERAAALGPGGQHFVPVEFGRDDLRAALTEAGHSADTPTTWVWEGVVPYLTREQVASTVAEIAGSSAPGSRLVVNYQAASTGMSAALLLMRAASLVFRTASPWRNEPWLSVWTPADLAALLSANGFTTRRDDDLAEIAAAVPMVPRRPEQLRSSRVTVADRL